MGAGGQVVLLPGAHIRVFYRRGEISAQFEHTFALPNLNLSINTLVDFVWLQTLALGLGNVFPPVFDGIATADQHEQ